MLKSDDVIENLVQLVCGETASAQDRHVYRESLRNLVRLAKAEQKQEIRMDRHQINAVRESDVLH
ncbi:hypothetical protein ACFQAT_09995 [Undibacterium arcticum]|uniref:Uncharacterized protein n=1 Tax=Undibacterium arcticum TaxID=1762892 RepID=A0ABV7F5F7_9BURK